MKPILLALAALVTVASPALSKTCQEIRFAAGAYSGIVSGASRFDDYVCYGIGVSPGQTVQIEILQGGNTAFSVPGVSDGQISMAFRATAGRYEIRVFQLFRSATDEAFRMQVTVR